MTQARDRPAEPLFLVVPPQARGETEIPFRALDCCFGNLPLFLCLLPASQTKALAGIAADVPLIHQSECSVTVPQWLSAAEGRESVEPLLPQHQADPGYPCSSAPIPFPAPP